MIAVIKKLFASFGFVLLLGLGLIWGSTRLFESESWLDWNYRNEVTVAMGNKVETAVLVIAIIFIILFGVALLNNTIHKNKLGDRHGLNNTNPKPSQFFTHPAVHGDYNHLLGNTPYLLLFAAFSVIITPSLQAFILASAIILIVQGIAIWWYGQKGSHRGASGFVMGYFSFVVVYGFSLQSWQTIIAILTLILFGRWVYLVLKNREEGISHIGHFWGFMGGILAAMALFYLGN